MRSSSGSSTAMSPQAAAPKACSLPLTAAAVVLLGAAAGREETSIGSDRAAVSCFSPARRQQGQVVFKLPVQLHSRAHISVSFCIAVLIKAQCRCRRYSAAWSVHVAPLALIPRHCNRLKQHCSCLLNLFAPATAGISRGLAAGTSTSAARKVDTGGADTVPRRLRLKTKPSTSTTSEHLVTRLMTSSSCAWVSVE